MIYKNYSNYNLHKPCPAFEVLYICSTRWNTEAKITTIIAYMKHSPLNDVVRKSGNRLGIINPLN